jgi:Choline/Carnitine o-acyltransferase
MRCSILLHTRWVLSHTLTMSDLTNSQDPRHLRTLFLAAAERHMTYASWAASAQGVDRHLFGLKKCVKAGETMPHLLTDEGYTKSSHWEMSTSQLSSPFFDGWGYGEGQFLSPQPTLEPELMMFDCSCAGRVRSGVCFGPALSTLDCHQP